MPDQEATPPARSERNSEQNGPTGPAPGGEQRSWGSSDRLENTANILTVLVALAAIGLAVWEGYQNRQFFRLSVLPYLEPIERTQSETDSTDIVRLAIENTGLGPAVLQNVFYFRDNEKIFEARQPDSSFSLWGEMRTALEPLPFGYALGTYSRNAGEMLESGEEHAFIQIVVPEIDTLDRSTTSIVWDSVFSTRSFVFCYCSVYGTDCDMAYLGAEPPVENACGF